MWFLSLIPNDTTLWVLHALVAFGIATFIGSYFVGPYKIFVTPIAVMIILFAVFFEGNYYGTKDYRAKVSEMQEKVNDAVTQSNKTNTIIQTKYVDKIRVVKENTNANVQVVEKIITKYDNKCELSNAAIVLHNSASQNAVAPSTGKSIEGASDVKVSDLLRTVNENYGIYYQAREQVIGWQQWYSEQKKIYESVK